MSTVTLRGPLDAIAAVPSLIGFVPEDSHVILGLQGQTLAISVRVDFGTPSSVFLPAFEQAGVDTAVIVTYGYEEDDADLLVQALEAAGFHVLDSMYVHEGMAGSYFCESEGCCPRPVTDALPNVELGVVTGTRDEVVASFQHDAHTSLREKQEPSADRDEIARALVNPDPRAVTDEIVAAFRDHCEATIDGRDRMLGALNEAISPEGVMSQQNIATVARHLSDEEYHSVAVLASAAYISGNGMAARTLVERVLDKSSMAQLVNASLDHGLPPQAYAEVIRESMLILDAQNR